jgi:beta-N-acetylhexosaminidase
LQVPEEVLEKFILGFFGHTLPSELRDYLAAGLAGVILFPRNFSGAEELFSLTQDIRRAAGHPVLIGIDQEGGTRFSLPRPFTQWVSPEELGRIGDPEIVERQAKAMARELRAAGVNLDFAPMLDLHLHPDSPVTKGRSFGSKPEEVAKLGEAVVRGFILGGILACAKHCPGHGDTTVDPHEGLPVFDGTLERLRGRELVPFASAATAGAFLMMTAHILMPEIDPDRPASLSPKILRDLLRDEMGYGGVILADDLGMGAVSRFAPPGELAVKTFAAGSDMALICHDWTIVPAALAGVAGADSESKIDQETRHLSHHAIENLHALQEIQEQLVQEDPLPLSIIGCAEHRELVREVRSRLGRSKN